MKHFSLPMITFLFMQRIKRMCSVLWYPLGQTKLIIAIQIQIMILEAMDVK